MAPSLLKDLLEKEISSPGNNDMILQNDVLHILEIEKSAFLHDRSNKSHINAMLFQQMTIGMVSFNEKLEAVHLGMIFTSLEL